MAEQTWKESFKVTGEQLLAARLLLDWYGGTRSADRELFAFNRA